MKKNSDPMGHAIADFYRKGNAKRLRVLSPMFEEDEIPVALLFRDYDHMPPIERRAVDMAVGRVLDVGAGAGCHSLVLQARGVDVTPIDISPLAVATMQARGLLTASEQDFFTLILQYDTILMLMNGIGIVGSIDRMPAFFRQLDRILAPGGQVLCDSSDISYLFENEDGNIELPAEGYYGEHSFTMQYGKVVGDPFPWLYIDSDTLMRKARTCGYDVEVIAHGEHYDFLARITKRIN